MAKHHAMQEVWAQQNFFNRLRPKLLQTARAVSQWIMHASISNATKIELELRLAHFEAKLELTDELLSNTMIAVQNAR